jgi:hypothetical protein
VVGGSGIFCHKPSTANSEPRKRNRLRLSSALGWAVCLGPLAGPCRQVFSRWDRIRQRSGLFRFAIDQIGTWLKWHSGCYTQHDLQMPQHGYERTVSTGGRSAVREAVAYLRIGPLPSVGAALHYIGKSTGGLLGDNRVQEMVLVMECNPIYPPFSFPTSICFEPSLKYLMVRSSPRSSSVVGVQPSASLAREIFG